MRKRRRNISLIVILAAPLILAIRPVAAAPTPTSAIPETPPSSAPSTRDSARTAARKAEEARAHFDAQEERAERKFVLETKPAKTIEATLTQTITVPECRVEKWVLFAARPVDGPGQRNVTWSMDPPAKESHELGSLGALGSRRPVLVAKVAVKDGENEENRHAVTVRVTYRAELLGRDLKPRGTGATPGGTPADVEPPGKRERAAALAATTTFDFDSAEFQDWLDHAGLRPNSEETEMDFAARAFKGVKGACGYEYTEDMDRRSSHVCACRKSDCGGLSALFVSVLRANGIPARQLMGRWARSEKPGEKVGDVEYHQQHAKAEFFAAGVGWVPADPTSAVLWDKSADGLAFFGHDAGDLLVFHYDDDFRLRTVLLNVQQLPYLQQVGFWVTGDGPLDGLRYETMWEVKPVGSPHRRL